MNTMHDRSFLLRTLTRCALGVLTLRVVALRVVALRVVALRVVALSALALAAFPCHGEKLPPFRQISPEGKARYLFSDRYHRIGNDYVTPHIRWAKPLAGGSVRALVIAKRWAHRETVELAQRLSLDYAAIMTLEDPDHFVPTKDDFRNIVGCNPEEFRAEFEKKLAGDYDVILLGNFKWKVLPADIEEKIVSKLEQGTGLVLVVPPDSTNERLDKILSRPRVAEAEQAIQLAVPVAHVPGLAEAIGDREGPLVQCVRYGAGNVVVLRYAKSMYEGDYSSFGMTPRPTNKVVVPALAFDYYQSLVARAVVWAAGKQSQVRIGGVGIRTTPVSAEQFAAEPLEIQIKNLSETNVSAAVEVVARPWSGEEEQAVGQTVEVAPGDSQVLLSLPRLRGGPHFVDVWIRQEGKVLDWFSGYVEIVPDGKVAAIEFTRPSFPIGGTVDGSVSLAGSIDAKTQLEIEMSDSFGRVMARDVVVPNRSPSTVTFSFPFEQPIAVQHQIVATLTDAEGVVDRQERLFAPSDLPPYDDFAVLAFGAHGTNYYRSRMIAQRCGELGMDSVYVWPASSHDLKHEVDWQRSPLAYWTTRAGMSLGIYATYLGGQMTDGVRKPCLSDPAFIAGKTEKIGTAARIFRHMGGVFYSTGDEYVLSEPGEHGCSSEWCLGGFCEWLKKKHGTLERLNLAWDADFATWEQVERVDLAKAQASGNYSQWSDGRAHMEHVFTNIHALLRAEVEQHHPGAPVGEEGMFPVGTYWGVDWEEYRDAATIVHGYDRRVQHEQIRSLARPGSLTGYWFGSYHELADCSEPKMRAHPWFSLFNGYNGAWWFTAAGFGTEREGSFNPDLTVNAAFDWSMQEVREIKRGPGKLLLNCQRRHDGVAIHYSAASDRAAYAHPFGKPHWTGAVWHARQAIGPATCAWDLILEDLGLQYEYVCTGDIEAGALVKQGFKAFIMPVSQALTQREAHEIQQFVRSGGIVIADQRPGVLNSDLNPSHPAMLDNLFGITRQSRSKELREVDLTITLGSAKRHLPASAVDEGVQPTTGASHGGSRQHPAVIQNHFGDGRATLLNFSIGDYYDEWRGEGALVTDLRNTSWGENIRGLIADLLAEGSIQPRVHVRQEDGKPLIAVESVFFEEGHNQYLGLLYKPDMISFFLGNKDWIANHYDLQPDISPQPILVQLERPYHVYDVRQGKYAGVTDQISTKIAPGEALLYALLPYRVTGVSVQGPAEVTLGQQASFHAAVSTSVSKSGSTSVSTSVSTPVPAEGDGGETPGAELHCFRVEVISPSGEVVKEYAQNVLAPEGAAGFSVPFALSDAEGVWQLSIKDIATGVTAQSEVKLIARSAP